MVPFHRVARCRLSPSLTDCGFLLKGHREARVPVVDMNTSPDQVEPFVQRIDTLHVDHGLNGPILASEEVFCVVARGGAWSIQCKGKFFGTFSDQQTATEAAIATAQKAFEKGCVVRVLVPAFDNLVSHKVGERRGSPA